MKQAAIHSVALAPRLAHCVRLIDGAMDELRRGSGASPSVRRDVQFCLDAMSEVRRRVRSASRIDAIPSVLPPAIPLVRAAGARLAATLPACSDDLCELAVHMGSIVVDSAILAGVPVDVPGRPPGEREPPAAG